MANVELEPKAMRAARDFPGDRFKRLASNLTNAFSLLKLRELTPSDESTRKTTSTMLSGVREAVNSKSGTGIDS